MDVTSNIYNTYLDIITTEEVGIKTEIEQHNQTKLICKDIITNNPDMFGTFYFKVVTFLDTPDVSICRLFRAYAMKEAAEVLLDYLDATNNIKLLTDKLNDLSKLKIDYSIFRDIFKAYNLKYVSFIIQGYHLPLGRSFGSMRIKEHQDTEKDRRIDWGTSIAYRNHLIKEGKETYLKDVNDNGIKWHVYFQQDYSYWFHWYKPIRIVNNINDPNELVNIKHNDNLKCFRFIPSSYCGTARKNLALYVKGKTDTNDIILDSKLGSIEKMITCLRIDKSWYLKYRDNLFKGQK